MTNLNVFRLCLSVAALGLFFIGLKAEQDGFRWAAVACLAAAVGLRFVGPRPPGRR